MNEKFISDLIEDFFDTGILNCNVLQLNSIFEITKTKVRELKGEDKTTAEYHLWANFYRMILVYMGETKIQLNMSTKEVKVSFKDYLLKVYGLNLGELDEVASSIIFDNYKSFVESNCCNKCLYNNVTSICSKCACYEAYEN